MVPYEITVVTKDAIPDDWYVRAGFSRWEASDFNHYHPDEPILHAKVVPEYKFCHIMTEDAEIASPVVSSRQIKDWPTFDGDYRWDTNWAYNGDTTDVFGYPEDIIDRLYAITDPAGNC